MASLNDFGSLQRSTTEELVNATRTVSKIAAQDLVFERSSSRTTADALDEKSARLLSLTQKLLNRAAPTSSSKRIRLSDVDSLEDCWRDVVDATDGLFERADSCLDDFKGLFRTAAQPEVKTFSKRNTSRPSLNDGPAPEVARKPQLDFEHPPSNFQPPPFKPLLTAKPHARQSLSSSQRTSTGEDDLKHYEHPYQEEIATYQWPPLVMSQTEPTESSPFEGSGGIWVDTVEGVEEMLRELKSADIIAIDVEHHDTHSYLGLVSLLQISIRGRDWVIDTLKPWRRRLEMLNEVFTDPRIVKVLHGAHMDVIWLQRDLGLYLVGLFDTYHACKVLHFPGASLAFLLKKYVNFDAQKQHQLADWRVRPLPLELFEYARSDTHFLIYIFERLRNELLSPDSDHAVGLDQIDQVLQRSKETALQTYELPLSTDNITSRRNGWAALLVRETQNLSSQQVCSVCRLFNWRDQIAREEDESVNFILPNRSLLTLSKALPQSSAEIDRMLQRVSPVLSGRLDEMARVISLAVVDGADFPDLKTVLDQYPAKWHHSYSNNNNNKVQVTSVAAPIPQVLGKPGFSTDQDGSRLWGELLTDSNALQQRTSSQYFDIIRPGGESGFDFSLQHIAGPSGPAKQDPGHIPSPNPPPSHGVTSDAGLNAANSSQAFEQVESQIKSKARDTITRRRDIDAGSTAHEKQLFDYEHAPSLLNNRGRRTLEASVPNPYAKAENAPKGVKRPHDSRPDKSLTYKQ